MNDGKGWMGLWNNNYTQAVLQKVIMKQLSTTGAREARRKNITFKDILVMLYFNLHCIIFYIKIYS